jgi:hypothetical protein
MWRRYIIWWKKNVGHVGGGCGMWGSLEGNKKEKSTKQYLASQSTEPYVGPNIKYYIKYCS